MNNKTKYLLESLDKTLNGVKIPEVRLVLEDEVNPNSDILFEKNEQHNYQGVSVVWSYEMPRYSKADESYGDSKFDVEEKEQALYNLVKKQEIILENKFNSEFKNFCSSGIKGSIGMYNKMVSVNSSCHLTHLTFPYDKNYGPTRQPVNTKVFEFNSRYKSEKQEVNKHEIDKLRSFDLMTCNVFVLERLIVMIHATLQQIQSNKVTQIFHYSTLTIYLFSSTTQLHCYTMRR
jgi:hypothetical protein